MGSGASQEVSAKVKDNSAEDLEKLFKELPAEEVEKVLKAAQAAKDAGSSEDSAPYLRKAFQFLMEEFSKMMEAEETGVDEPELDQDKMMETYTGFIKQSFEHHDKKKAGKLDKDDASLFFKHFLQECQLFVEAMVIKRSQLKMKELKKRVEESLAERKDEYPNFKEHLPGAFKAAQASINKMITLAKAEAKANAEAFAANKDALTCAAFAQSDEDGDGSLTLEEFIESVTIGSEKHENLSKLLGIDLERAVDGDEFGGCMQAAEKAVELYMKEKLGLPTDDPAKAETVLPAV